MGHQNRAAWVMQKQQTPFEIGDAETAQPQSDEVLIRNHAVAMNPADWACQAMGILIPNYPFILGCDAAGEVVAVGADVKHLKPGDRVLANAYDGVTKDPRSCAFQLYMCVLAKGVAKIPDSISYAQAAVLPLGLTTAAVGLFSDACLGLPLPQISPKKQGKVVLVWGGGSSVGSCAIQLAKAAGFEVAATASKHNLDYLRNLGADYVFDARSESVIEDVVAGLRGKEFGGALDSIIDGDTILSCARIASALGGNKYVATVVPEGMPLPDGLPGDVKFGNSKNRTCLDS